jgi:hypothetical protein
VGASNLWREPAYRRCLIAALAVTAAAWLAAWAVRVVVKQPFIDDYLYAGIALGFWHDLAGGHLLALLRGFLGSGTSAPLVPLLAAPVSGHGPDLAVLVQLPLLLGLCAVLFHLLARFQPPARAAVAAGVISLMPAMLAWSVMLSMGVAAALFSLAALDLGLLSDGLRDRRLALATGAALGLLTLSRAMAPLYVVAVVAALALAWLRHRRRPEAEQLRNALLAAAVTAAIAGPWWLRSGPAALRYLATAGYNSQSGFTLVSNPLVQRFGATADEWAGGIGVLLLLGLVLGVRAWRRPPDGEARAALGEPLFALLAFSLLVFVGLATTANNGTAFALPPLAALGLAAALAVGLSPRAWRAWAATGGAVAALGLAQLTAGAAAAGNAWTGWFPEAPYKLAAERALRAAPTHDTSSDAVQTRILTTVRGGTLWVVRDDAIVNLPGLHYERLRDGLGDGGVAGPSRALDQPVGAPPAGYGFVISGTACIPYHRNYDEASLEATLRQLGFRLADRIYLSPCSTVLLWHRPVAR